MSIWTHVAATVRVDGIRFNDDDPEMYDRGINNLFDEVFGKECPWEAPHEIWEDADKHPDAYLPMGSEGSLKKSIWTNPDKSSMASWTVSIFGDLRDFSDLKDIEDWFNKACDKLYVRQAVFTATNGVEEITKAYEGEV